MQKTIFFHCLGYFSRSHSSRLVQTHFSVQKKKFCFLLRAFFPASGNYYLKYWQPFSFVFQIFLSMEAVFLSNRKVFSGADFMEIFNPDWNFSSVYQVEISSQLKRKLFFKMTLQLHVKISTQDTELKFQLGLANPRWNFNPGCKSQIFHIIDSFSNPGLKFDTTHARMPCLLKKNKDGNFTSTIEMNRQQTYQSFKGFWFNLLSSFNSSAF